MPAAVNRRKGREWALQMIVQADLNPDVDVDKMILFFWEQQWSCKMEADDKKDEDLSEIEKALTPAERLASTGLCEFTEQIVRGTLGVLKDIDDNIQKYSHNWSLYRIGVIERCVLRLAFYEISIKSAPQPVIINEAIDVAKYFSNADAGRFVNGVLDKYCKDLCR